MSIIRLAWINYKRMIKSSENWLMMFLLPVGIILITLFTQTNEKAIDATEAAFNIEDNGYYGEVLINEIGVSRNIFINDYEGAISLLENKDVSTVYIIPENFTQSLQNGILPTIEQVKDQEGRGPIVTEALIQEWIHTKLYEEILINEGLITSANDISGLEVTAVPIVENNYVNPKLRVTMILIIFYIIYASAEVCGQMGKLKSDNILLRAATTSNPWKKITGSIYIALFFIEVSIFFLVFMAAKTFGKFQVEAPFYMILSIILAVCISISLGFLLLRFVKKAEIITMISIIISIGMFFISLMGSGNDTSQASWIINNLAKFMPIYWLMDIVNHLRLFPAVPILILMAVAMFTAGNIKGSKKELIER
ncbi:ABC-2 type transport system permease protein [Natranaerovirga pectinivora]|uniref:ABC-2 type transport system permease protein n=1 Tax=Natranaerovirga pectinivora TaxID=682400 RepID=A0A4R3MFK0_9FIRM|nr:ABC transporter permease [Natranaerovirga pectinivora]TCT12288.1 ABC-2 type transport system permease protein [Natranaerovirga pectinivora]